jgi:hypothetical protein
LTASTNGKNVRPAQLITIFYSISGTTYPTARSKSNIRRPVSHEIC